MFPKHKSDEKTEFTSNEINKMYAIILFGTTKLCGGWKLERNNKLYA